MLAGNAARIYGFDLDALAPLAAAGGPQVDPVAAGLDRVAEGPQSLVFRRSVVSNV